jgi:hypothetical protein
MRLIRSKAVVDGRFSILQCTFHLLAWFAGKEVSGHDGGNLPTHRGEPLPSVRFGQLGELTLETIEPFYDFGVVTGPIKKGFELCALCLRLRIERHNMRRTPCVLNVSRLFFKHLARTRRAGKQICPVAKKPRARGL